MKTKETMKEIKLTISARDRVKLIVGLDMAMQNLDKSSAYFQEYKILLNRILDLRPKIDRTPCGVCDKWFYEAEGFKCDNGQVACSPAHRDRINQPGKGPDAVLYDKRGLLAEMNKIARKSQ